MHKRAMAIVVAASMLFISLNGGIGSAATGSDEWTGPVTLGYGYIMPPRVAASPGGGSLVAYDLVHESDHRLGFNAYIPGVGWSPQQIVPESETNRIESFDVAIGPNGFGIALWSTYVPSADASWLWTADYLPTFGWSAPVPVTYVNGFCAETRAAVDAEGTRTVAWVCVTGPSATLFASSAPPGGLWPLADEVGVFGELPLGLDLVAGGNVTVATWVSTDFVNHTVQANRHTLARGWEGPEMLQKLSSPDAEVSAGVSSNGDLMVVWRGNAGFGNSLSFARRPWADSWTPAIEVLRSPVEVIHVALAQLPTGEAHLVYTVLGSRSQAWAVNWTTGPLWNTPVPLFQDADLGAVNVAVAVDESGAAVAAWSTTHYDTNLSWDVQDVWVSRYDPQEGWSAAMAQPVPASVEFIQPSVAAGGGAVVVAWFGRTFSTGQIVYAVRYEIRDRTAPALDVFAPAEGSTVRASTTTVTGRAEAGATVRVNGVSAPVAADGVFRLDVPIPQGAFVLNVTAADAVGNTALVAVRVIGADPAVALAAEAAMAQANATAAAVAAAAAEANATAARAQIVGAEANASAARAATAQMTLNVTQLQVQVDGLQEDLRLSNVALNQTRGDLQSSTADVTAITGQLAALSLLAAAGLLAALAGIGLTIITQRRASAGKVEVKGWDPKKKEE